MGVDINPLIRDAKKTITFKDLVGKSIAIDAFNTIYQFLSIIRGIDGAPLTDFQGNVTSHLSGLFYRTLNIIEHDIRPIFVFDGLPNPLKMAEIQRRREIRHNETKKYEEARDLGETEEASKHAQATSKLTGDMIQESKEFLHAMGIPTIDAPEDGEAQAAFLVEQKHAWAVGSQDYDSLLFGAQKVVRNLSQSRTRKVKGTTVKVDIEWLSLEKVLGEIQISREQLVDVAILVGVDFFEGIKGVGAKTALKLIQDHQSLESMINKEIKVRNTRIADFIDIESLHTVQNIFLKPNVTADFPKIRWTTPDNEKIREILIETHNFNIDRVESGLKRLKKKGTARQKTLGDFF
ncbi:MAG: flap endonuclease-1 [Promethearchaeota archaeon]|nr:MAG: flap endonuclease-1 [Candidatus Lokiarchaeota archaeon]